MHIRRIAISATISASLVLIACIGAGEALSRPATRIIGPPPADLQASPVALGTTPKERVSGWFIRCSQARGGILLLHGVRADRTSMTERARLFRRLGYSVLLIDLPAHGESTGERITFGLNEGLGVKTALDHLRRELPGQPIGVVGVSLGAASLVLSKAAPPPDAVVLESMYPTITEAVTDRLTRRLGAGGNLLAPLLLWQLPVRLGISTSDLRPIDEIPSLNAPVLIASGTKDEHTTLAESQRIFDAARAPKEFWPVEGTAHVDLYTYAPRTYESRISSFFAKYLRDGG